MVLVKLLEARKTASAGKRKISRESFRDLPSICLKFLEGLIRFRTIVQEILRKYNSHPVVIRSANVKDMHTIPWHTKIYHEQRRKKKNEQRHLTVCGKVEYLLESPYEP